MKKHKRICFVLRVRTEKIEEYKQRHSQVWPEMLSALQASGWNNYSLFLRQDGLLVGYFETSDFEQAQNMMKEHPVNTRWQHEMATYFDEVQIGSVDDSLAPLTEVFHLD